MYASSGVLRFVVSLTRASAAKQLAKAFDQFKAYRGLRVFSESYSRGAIRQHRAKLPPLPEDTALVLPPYMAESREPILASAKELKHKGALKSGLYYVPEAENHPLIDRAAVDSSGRYIILYRDTISNDATEAFASLQAACDVLRPRNRGKQFICVANGVNAGEGFAPLKALPDWYAVISDADLENVYTPTFAPIFRYLFRRQRLLKHGFPPPKRRPAAALDVIDTHTPAAQPWEEATSAKSHRSEKELLTNDGYAVRRKAEKKESPET